ncbi:FHA domain-containing protein [Corynebacterium yudongzhengii]|uniref:FHA domain-containing protein n=1 Tax=Corynebacterium yudongzhengii TaxID=2080740 RepID=A0A2U1T577_9CORY|nr:FHA domain-containing protein [Corynebacterium yudongzhengii]AWB80959.1 FHA domain-containing protein [Corynebacterium yudongzhengii]PWC01115.1 FHA domain-containing protein [Corynebacterium yudongzhengii]
MDAAVLGFARIALLVLLWVFILLALTTMRADADSASGRPGRKRGKRSRVPRLARPAAMAGPARRQKARVLTVVEGPYQGSHMDISQVDSVVLGRSDACEFVLGDDYASSRHARLLRRGSDWFIEDLESRNGTFVGGYRIDQPERVQVGTDIKLGGTTVRLAP